MTRIALFLTAVLTAGFATVQTINLTLNETWQMSETLAQDRVVHNRYVAYQCFKHTFETTLYSLGSGQISLCEAHTRVLSSAQRYNPDFLNFLFLAEPGKTVVERLAYNLVGHVRSVEEVHANPQSHLPLLEDELREVLAELDAANP